jgi:hypothetical protein
MRLIKIGFWVTVLCATAAFIAHNKPSGTGADGATAQTSLTATKSSNDETAANFALGDLHEIAVAASRAVSAAKDGDDIGCREAAASIQEAGHAALTNLHTMSFVPADAIQTTSGILHIMHDAGGQCVDHYTAIGLPMFAAQAILHLRWDYAVGTADWYTAKGGGVEAANPLKFAQSLRDKNYSWVDVRPKDELIILVPDWKAEMASHRVDDPSIEDSGTSLKAVEVGYRVKPDDKVTATYFYRTKEDAEAAEKADAARPED